MADAKTPRDPEEQLVATAFSAYRAAAPKNFPAPSASELMARADTTRPRRRVLTVALAALAFTGLIAGGAAVAHTVVSVGSDPTEQGKGGSTMSTGDQETPSSGPDDSSSPSSDPSDEDGIKGAKITLPTWPNRSGICQPGEYTFDEEGTSKPDSGWSLKSEGIYTTLDDDGTANDLIVDINCGDMSGVIALEKTEDEDDDKDVFSSKGFVETADKPGTVVKVTSVDGKRVTLDTGITTEDHDSSKTFVYTGDGFIEEPDDEDPSDEPSSPSGTPSDDPTSTSSGPSSSSD